MGGVPVHVQAGGRVPAAVPPLAVPLSTGLAHVVRCLPGETSLQHFFLFIILMLIKSFNVLILLLLLWLFISKCNQCGKALVPHFQHWGAVFPR